MKRSDMESVCVRLPKELTQVMEEWRAHLSGVRGEKVFKQAFHEELLLLGIAALSSHEAEGDA